MRATINVYRHHHLGVGKQSIPARTGLCGWAVAMTNLLHKRGSAWLRTARATAGRAGAERAGPPAAAAGPGGGGRPPPAAPRRLNDGSRRPREPLRHAARLLLRPGQAGGQRPGERSRLLCAVGAAGAAAAARQVRTGPARGSPAAAAAAPGRRGSGGAGPGPPVLGWAPPGPVATRMSGFASPLRSCPSSSPGYCLFVTPLCNPFFIWHKHSPFACPWHKRVFKHFLIFYGPTILLRDYYLYFLLFFFPPRTARPARWVSRFGCPCRCQSSWWCSGWETGAVTLRTQALQWTCWCPRASRRSGSAHWSPHAGHGGSWCCQGVRRGVMGKFSALWCCLVLLMSSQSCSDLLVLCYGVSL